MKIGFFTDGYLPQLNGVATSVTTAAENLRKKGHEVYVIAPKYPHFKDKKYVIRLSSIRIHNSLDFRVATHLPEPSLLKISRIDFDIIHGHAGGPVSLLGWEFARLKRVPFVFTYHTFWNQYTHYILYGAVIKPKAMEIASRIFSNRADIVIAPTPRVKEELHAYGVKKPILFIPNGVDLTQFTKKPKGFLRKKLNLSPDKKILLYVGRLGKEKSIDFILKAFVLVKKKSPNTCLVLVGEGPEDTELKRLATRLQIADSVYFIGAVPYVQLVHVYNDADLFVFASKTETQGMVLLEAMACEVPVAIVADPALEMVVKHASNGSVSKRTPVAYAEAMVHILENKQYTTKIIREAKKTVLSFSIDRTTSLLEKTYTELIQKYAHKKPRDFMKDVLADAEIIKRLPGKIKRFFQMKQIN